MHLRVIAATAAAAALVISVPARAEYLEVKSRHFTFTGDVSEALLRRRAERLERFDAALRLIVPKSTEANLPVVVVPAIEDVRRLLGGQSSAGAFFSPSNYGVFAVTPASAGEANVSNEAILFHEYVHYMLMSSVDDAMPRWMNEGMAELFMNTRLSADGSVTVGLGNSFRSYSLNRIDRWDVERLFNSDRVAPRDSELDQVYAKGWLVLHYLIFSGKRQGQFATFNDAMRKGMPQMDAARHAFGDLGKFNSELEYYRARKELPALRIPAEQIKAVTDVAVRRLSPGEAAIFDARTQSRVGVTEKTAGVLAARARPIGARFPSDAMVQRAMAEIEYDARNYAGADAAIDLSLKADPKFVDAIAFKGLLVGARAVREKNPALWREARSWIVRANRADSNNPFPLHLYFDSFAAAGERPPKVALDGALRAVQLQPSLHDLRVKAAAALIAEGSLKDARHVLAPAALAPHMKANNPAALLLAGLDAGETGAGLAPKLAALKLARSNIFAQASAADHAKDDDKKVAIAAARN